MAGNVSEWTFDVFRPLTATSLRDVENHDLNPFRGNEFKELILDESGNPIEKDSLGRLQYQLQNDSLLINRENYNKNEVKDYFDDDDEAIEYAYGKLFWCAPGARRFKDEDKSDRTLGFRCAMTRTGGPEGNDDAGGLEFKRKQPKQKRSYK